MLKTFAALAVAGMLIVSGTAGAQKTESMGTGKGGSPHEKTTWTVNGATISIAYGRPYLKGRPEAQLMPAGQPWRSGADEATVIASDKPLTFGEVKLAPGSYTINTEPGDNAWQIIFGKLNAPGQWGVPYQKQLEIGRAPMKLSKAAKSVDQVTFAIEGGATPALKLEWGTVVATAPFSIGK